MTTYLTQLLLDQTPEQIYKSQREYLGGGPTARTCPNSNFLKGVKWSPDGACLLTASEDNWLRVYDLPAEALEQGPLETAGGGGAAAAPDNLPAVLYLDEGETIYDYAWYPGMLASDPASCVFASTVRAHPLHLWDAVSGQLRATYRAYDAVDEVTAAYSVAFSHDGTRILGGYNKMIRIFDTSRPGRYYTEIVTHSKKSHGLQGIVSCMASNEDGSGMLAAGAYSGDAAVLDERTGELLYVLQGQKGGITQVQFSRDGNFLYTGARRDPDIFCWDVRFTSDVVYRMQRQTASTNQRIQFGIEPSGRHLATGGTDGKLLVFDLRTGEPVASHTAAADTLNGVHFHPFLPLAATASGHRRFALEPETDADSDIDMEGSEETGGVHTSREDSKACSNALLVWRFGACTVEVPLESNGAESDNNRGPEAGSTAATHGLSVPDVPAGHEIEPQHVVEAGLCDQSGVLGQDLQTPHVTEKEPNG